MSSSPTSGPSSSGASTPGTSASGASTPGTPTPGITPRFGRLLTAMVTPFAADESLDLPGAVALATYLVDELGHDGLVVSGTTGESPTTTGAEKIALLEAVLDAVGDRAHVISGVGSFDTRHTETSATEAAAAGAHGLLVVTPYYSRPPQAGILAHFTRVADATDLPVMVYDVPHRSAAAIATETLIALAEHPRIVAVKDAKGDLAASARVIAETELAYYSGDDPVTLPLLSVGAVGVVGTSTHFTGLGMKALIEAYLAGDVAGALALHQRLLPVFTGIFATQGCTLVKAGLALQGRDVGGLRSPQVVATPEQVRALAAALDAAGLASTPA